MAKAKEVLEENKNEMDADANNGSNESENIEGLYIRAQEAADSLIEAASQKAQSIIAEAEKRVEQMFDDASSKPAINNITIQAPEKEKASLPDYLKEMQAELTREGSIELFKDGDKYSDDKFISVNGTHRYQIQRGMEVRVPQYIKEVNQQSMRQDLQTTMLMNNKQNESESRYHSGGYEF